MKRIFGILAICSLMITASYSQSETSSQQVANEESNTAFPVMTFESTEIDYGVIKHKADPYREFHFTNTGDAPLIISNAKGSCGCTVPEWSKEPVAPGESNIIKVRYATDRIGKFSKTITITTNEAQGKHVLRIKGEVLNSEIKIRKDAEKTPKSGVENQQEKQ